MIWSTPSRDLDLISQRFERSGMLRHTQLIDSDLSDREVAIDPINYFEVPPIAHSIGKLVIPYVVIDQAGFLVDAHPAIYGVTKRANAYEGTDASRRRAQEAHVLAEDLAFRRGIFTNYGRASSEVFAASLIPDSYIVPYVDDRLAHLGALTTEAEDSIELKPKSQAKIIHELELAKKSLQTRITRSNI